VARLSERIIVIAEDIDRYVTEHPRAADTPRGIHGWWVAGHRRGDSLADVQMALDHLVARGRLSRVALPDGTAIYARAAAPDDEEPH
jgi:hypothetical protein